MSSEPFGRLGRLSGMHLLRTAAITSLAAICLVGSASAVAAESAPDEPGNEPAGELLASLTVQGLFPVSAPFLANSPTVAVYDDGTVLALDPDMRIVLDAPPYLLGAYARVRIDDAAVSRLVTTAETLGLTDPAPQYASNPTMADAPRTWLVVGAGDARRVHVVDGLVAGEADPGRAAVAELAAMLRSIADDAVVDESAVYEPPSAVAIQAVPAAPSDSSPAGVVRAGPPYPAPDPVAWPDPSVRLADAADCVVVDDPVTVEMLADTLVDATFIDEGVVYAIAAQPVLPGHGCRPGDPAPIS